MGQDGELQTKSIAQDFNEACSTMYATVRVAAANTGYTSEKCWLRSAIYTLFVIFGQSAAIILERLYYNNGGKCKWMMTLVQYVGFPILIPFFSSLSKSPTTNSFLKTHPSTLNLVQIYAPFGVFLAANTMLYSIGLMYLPASTFIILSTFQLAFNAFFSSVLHQQKLAPFLMNSLVLFTISSTLLVLQSDYENPEGLPSVSYKVGMICTIVAAAGYGLMLPLIQMTIKRVLKKDTNAAILEMIIHMSAAASCVAVVGLVISGEWKGLKGEMEGFGLGKLSYVMILAQTAIASQALAIGTVGLIFEVSSLFSNLVSVLGLPLVAILAVIFLHENMDGIKVVSMGLAIWGFVSCVYQYYFYNFMSKTDDHIDVLKFAILETIVEE